MRTPTVHVLDVVTYAGGDQERPLTVDEIEQWHADADTWRQAATLTELADLGANWLEGKNIYLPAYFGADPDPETRPLIPTLAALNRAGIFTDSSQPGHGPVEGYDGRMWMQRAYVSGYTDADTMRSLGAAFGTHRDTLIFWCLPVRQGPRRAALDRDYFPATLRENDDIAETGLCEVMSVAGLTPTRRDVKELYGGDLSRAAVKTLQDAWHVTVAENEYEDSGRLWTTLADWANRRLNPAAPHASVVRTGLGRGWRLDNLEGA
jgi:hypothetical protein